MSRVNRKNLNQLVLENIMELERNKAFLEKIEIKIEDKYTKKLKKINLEK